MAVLQQQDTTRCTWMLRSIAVLLTVVAILSVLRGNDQVSQQEVTPANSSTVASHDRDQERSSPKPSPPPKAESRAKQRDSPPLPTWVTNIEDAAAALFKGCFEQPATRCGRSVVIVGTAHGSDAFKVVCRWLLGKHGGALGGGQQCPHEKQHVASWTVRQQEGQPVLHFAYRPLDEPLFDADLKHKISSAPPFGYKDGAAAQLPLETALSTASHVLYFRGILDLHHRNTPANDLSSAVAGRLSELFFASSKSAHVVVTLPHRVFVHVPPTVRNRTVTAAMAEYTLPARACVTFKRQQAVRHAIATGVATAVDADSSIAGRLWMFDPWDLSSAVPESDRAAAWMGHHFPEGFVASMTSRLLAALITIEDASRPEGPQSAATVRLIPGTAGGTGIVDTVKQTDTVSEGFRDEATDAPAMVRAERECDCMVYAPDWCTRDSNSRLLYNWPYTPSLDGTYNTSDKRYPIPEEGFKGDQRSDEIGCGGLPYDPRYVNRYRWHRVRIDDRTPFKPLLQQTVCDLRLLNGKHGNLGIFQRYPFPSRNENTPSRSEVQDYLGHEQCFVFFAASRREQTYLFDAEQCIATGAVTLGITGSSYGQYLHDFGIAQYLAGYFGYHAVLHEFEHNHVIVERPSHQRGVRAGAATSFKWQAPEITVDGKDTSSFFQQSWTDILTYRAGQDSTHFDRVPQDVYARYVRGLLGIAKQRQPQRMHVALESAAWGRKPLIDGRDPCLNPQRGEAYREAHYCAARRVTAQLVEESRMLKTRFFVYDPYWLSAQDFAHVLAERDGHHMRGPMITTEALHVFHRSCGDVAVNRRARAIGEQGIATEDSQAIIDAAFSYIAEEMDIKDAQRLVLFPSRDPRYHREPYCACYVRDCKDVPLMKRFLEESKKQHAARGWKRVDGVVQVVNSSFDAKDGESEVDDDEMSPWRRLVPGPE